ncbi:MAG TPA: hypothetical protein VGL86_22475 [Polyangia bacterium]
MKDAIALVGTPDLRRPSLFGVQSWCRLTALMTLATAAARADDRPLALASIRNTFAMLESFPQLDRQRAGFGGWESWARAYERWME